MFMMYYYLLQIVSLAFVMYNKNEKWNTIQIQDTNEKLKFINIKKCYNAGVVCSVFVYLDR